jgi:hypothetical protein
MTRPRRNPRPPRPKRPPTTLSLDWLTVAEAAAYVGNVTIYTVRARIRDKLLPTARHRIAGRRLQTVVSRAALDLLLQPGRVRIVRRTRRRSARGRPSKLPVPAVRAPASPPVPKWRPGGRGRPPKAWLAAVRATCLHTERRRVGLYAEQCVTCRVTVPWSGQSGGSSDGPARRAVGDEG